MDIWKHTAPDRKLKPGKYTLREDEAPKNYKIADPITFTLESKADVQTITMEDLRYADLTIVKRIKASDITWAHGNPTFIFTVKGKDINGKDRTFQDYVVFTESYVSSHTDSQGYVELSVTWEKSRLERTTPFLSRGLCDISLRM